MHYIGFLAFIVLQLLFFDYYARSAFISKGYPRKYGHGKTWKRAYIHYKTNWTFWERMFWVVVFKEKYDTKFRMFAYLSYIHIFLCVVTLIFTFVSFAFFPDSEIWKYISIGYCVYSLGRYVYSDYVLKGKFF